MSMASLRIWLRHYSPGNGCCALRCRRRRARFKIFVRGEIGGLTGNIVSLAFGLRGRLLTNADCVTFQPKYGKSHARTEHPVRLE
jgi:hypothetical protein